MPFPHIEGIYQYITISKFYVTALPLPNFPVPDQIVLVPEVLAATKR
jgi:hypothetical protein